MSVFSAILLSSSVYTAVSVARLFAMYSRMTSKRMSASGAQAPQTLLTELQSLESSVRTLEARISKAQRPAIVYNAALLLRVINEVRLAQQKPPEQVKPLLQAALTGVHVSPADDRIRFHGIDDNRRCGDEAGNNPSVA